MKRPTDDIANWRLQQENTSKPFSYVFPQMPPRFRRCCAFAKVVFLIQWGCFASFCLGSMMLFVPVIVFGKDVELSAITDNHPFPYYVPARGDNLKEKECLMAIKGLHIKYGKMKFCPLIIPSVCPECKCKFFEMAGDFPVGGWRSKSR